MMTTNRQETTTAPALRVLLLEDQENDAILVRRHLEREGFCLNMRRVFQEGAMREALLNETWDVVLSDFSMPQFRATDALRVLQSLNLDIPFIIISGTIGEAVAVQAMKCGAHDYLMKGNLDRLGEAIRREMLAAVHRREHRAALVSLKTSEERLAKAQEIARIGSWEWWPAKKELTWSDSLYRLFGLKTHQALDMDLILSRIHPDDHALNNAFIASLMNDQDEAKFEFRLLLPDGTLRYVLQIAEVLERENGEPTKIAGIMQDISERRLMEQEKACLQEQLIQAQKLESIGRLAGGIAHDFNNILGVIVGYADIILEKMPPADPFHHQVQEIFDAAQRSTTIARQLLTFARKQTATPSVIELNSVITATVKMLGRLIGEDIRLSCKPGIDLWPVFIDPTQVEQILANLCINARDAIVGTGHITIETQNVTFEQEDCLQNPELIPGDFSLLAVSDDGCGMTPETRENIFEPFFSTKAPGQGTGLGLATVYGIVKQNDGFLQVDSTPGVGTTFKLFFPRYRGDVKPAESTEAHSRGSSPRGQETILVVEDETAIRILTTKILTRLGYRVIAMDGPRTALDFASRLSEPVHLLLTDIIMPDMDGPHLAAELQRKIPGLRTLFMSGYTHDFISQRKIMPENVHLLNKPFSGKVLATAIRKVLDQD